MKNFPPIALTLGDPAGIGPEVVAKTLRDPRLPRGFRYEVLGQKSGRGIHPGRASQGDQCRKRRRSNGGDEFHG